MLNFPIQENLDVSAHPSIFLYLQWEFTVFPKNIIFLKMFRPDNLVAIPICI